MWISKKRYEAMLDIIAKQDNQIRYQREAVITYRNLYRKAEHDINLLKNINSPVDVIFPNTDERGLNGDSGSPTIPEIFEM